MSTEAERRINDLLDAAEQAGTYLVPTSAADRKALARRKKAGVLCEPLEGAYARPAYVRKLTPPQRTLHAMRSLSHLHPRWTFCNVSAAQAHGLPVTWSRLRDVHVITSPRSRRRSSRGITHHHVERDEAVEVGGLRVTSLWRTVFDCLATLALPDALAIADAALRKEGKSAGSIALRLRRTYRHHPGVRRAAEIAGLADGRSESGGESIARGVFFELGYELPELQVWVPDPVEPGRWFRVDYFWLGPGGKVVFGEFDGRAKSADEQLMGGRTTADVLQDERMRESHLTAYGFPVVRIGWEDVKNEAGRRRLAARLETYGVPRAGVPAAEEIPVGFLPYSSELMFLSAPDGGTWTVLATTIMPEDRAPSYEDVRPPTMHRRLSPSVV